MWLRSALIAPPHHFDAITTQPAHPLPLSPSPAQPLKAYLAKFREAEKKALAATNKARQQDNDA